MLEIGDKVKAKEGVGGALGVEGVVEDFCDFGSRMNTLVRCTTNFYLGEVGNLLAFNDDELEKI